jgi:hypothetical protein
MKNFVGGGAMFFFCRAINENVVEVNCDSACGDLISEDCIHECLEGGGGIGEPEEHHLRLKQASIGSKRSLPFVPCFDADVIISPADVELGEKSGMPEVIDDVRGQQEGISILDGEVV